MGEVRKRDVLQAFHTCDQRGDFPADFSVVEMAKHEHPVGSFHGKKFYHAKEILNTYVANILRQRKRFCVVKRDVQMYYQEHCPPYSIAINPPETECYEDDESEIALVARGDGDGHFVFIYYDDAFWDDFTQGAQTRAPANAALERRTDATIRRDLRFLKQSGTLYTMTGDVEDILYARKNVAERKSLDLLQYSPYIVENTEDSNDAWIFYTLKTFEQVVQDRQQCMVIHKKSFLQHEIERLESALIKRRLELEELL